MGKSVTDYPPTTKYININGPLKLPVSRKFLVSSKASFLFGVSMLFNVLGVHLTVSHCSEREPLGQHLGEPGKVGDHSAMMLCHTCFFLTKLLFGICQFPMIYICIHIITCQVWDGRITTCNSWQLFAISTGSYEFELSIKFLISSSIHVCVHHWCKNHLNY